MISSWNETRIYTIAHSVGWDAGNRSMKRNKRKKWAKADFRVAVEAFNKIMQEEGRQKGGNKND